MHKISSILGMLALFAVPTAVFAYTPPPECSPETRPALELIDTDSDGLTDAEEYCIYFTDPNNPDTDGDSYLDGEEIANWYSPLHANRTTLMDVDSDQDYLIDAWEIALGTNLMNPDTDGDLYLDGTEVAASYDPLNPNPVKIEKLIEIDTKGLSLSYFMGGKLLGTIPVSTGKRYTPTPKGEFTVRRKIPNKRYLGPTWDYPDVDYNLLFTYKDGWGYYIHSAYWHNLFGKSPVSGGCVNARKSDMKHLYWWAEQGTKVRIK